MSFEQLRVLPNGMRVWRSDVDTGLLLLQLNVMVGFQNEVADELLEFCHCNEHMAAKWTSDEFPSAQDNTLRLSQASIETNAFTTVDMTGYYMKGLSTSHDMMVDMFSHSFANPRYDGEVFDAEMAAVQNELQNIASSTWYPHDIAQRELLYAGTPLAKHEDIKIRNVQRLRDSADGMRELMRWRQANYNPSLCTLFVCGSLPESSYRRMLDTLGRLEPTAGLPRISRPIAAVPPDATVSASMEGERMHRVSFVFDARRASGEPVTSFSFHERAMMDLVSSVLSGAGLGARLYRRLRTTEKLIYAVSSGSSLEGCGRLRGKFIIDTKFQVGSDRDARGQLRKVVTAVMEELGKLAASGVSDAEMQQWRRAVRVNMIVARGIRDSRAVAATSYFEYISYVIPQLTYWDTEGPLRSYLGCAAPREVMDHEGYVRVMGSLRQQDVNAFARAMFLSTMQIIHTVP